MKTKDLFLLFLFSALSFQCSDDNGGEYDGTSVNPPKEDKTSYKPYSPIGISGYTVESNAQFIVTGVDSVEVAPQYAYVADYIQGRGELDWISETTNVYFNWDIMGYQIWVTAPEKAVYNLLCVSDTSGGLFLPQWDLSYAWDSSGGLTISGRGKGTHVPEAMLLYLEQSEAFKASEVIFEFRGTQVTGDPNISAPDIKGTFSIIEISPEPSFDLAIYGRMAIKFDISF